MKKWKTLDSKLAFDHKWFKVRQDTVQLPHGKILDDFFVWLEGDVVIVVPITSENKFVIVKQYKHGSGEIVLEFPAGMIDHNEDSEKAAQRELEEETGYTGDTLISLGTVFNLPTKVVGQDYIFLMQNAKKTKEPSFDENEEIEVLELTQEQVMQMIVSGEIKVTGTITAFLLAVQKLNKIDLKK
jgi:8-oxo-dGTP pyrophosphatase MutT (NUDIX family)